eukprot:jgi/Tetstr1/435698/TSEL_024597.t1
MATRSEVHTWLKALQGPAAGPAGSKVALAVCIYLAQPDIPDVASFLGAELSSVSSCETGPEQDMQLSVGGALISAAAAARPHVLPRDGSVLTVEQFCTVLGKAMKAADGVKRKGNAVLSYLSRTRE